MSAVLEEHIDHSDAGTTAPVVVVGTGPVGIHFVEEFLKRSPDAPVIICGGASQYTGSLAATRLKVVGVSVFSAGRTGERDAFSQLRTITWRSYDSTRYRKLLLQRNRLVGVVAFGKWDENSRVLETVQHARHVWPASTVVCLCTGVKHGTLSRAIRDGHCNIDALCAETGASSVCGSCKPLLAELLGAKTVEPEQGSGTLLWTGITALLAAPGACLRTGLVPGAGSALPG
ncbi:MAG: (2Fe-2S)-binding protein [Pseudomonadota bacterium]|nr:(2Fe-2S)-binding protein [Pseudomonadota bacterium]